MTDLSRRSAQAEMMDDPALTRAEFEACLRSLERVNIATLAYRPTLQWLRRMARGLPRDTPLSVLDIGSGGGDMVRRVHRAMPNRALDLLGVDLNPWSKTAADKRIPPGAAMRFETTDLFALPPERQADVIISSLFTHHLPDAAVVEFLRWMEAKARRGWFVNDLHRHWLPFHFIKYATAFFRMNRIVRHDAPVSVARAFVRADWERLLAEAGVPRDAVRIRWHFPFRYCVERDQLASGVERGMP